MAAVSRGGWGKGRGLLSVRENSVSAPKTSDRQAPKEEKREKGGGFSERECDRVSCSERKNGVDAKKKQDKFQLKRKKGEIFNALFRKEKKTTDAASAIFRLAWRGLQGRGGNIDSPPHFPRNLPPRIGVYPPKKKNRKKHSISAFCVGEKRSRQQYGGFTEGKIRRGRGKGSIDTFYGVRGGEKKRKKRRVVGGGIRKRKRNSRGRSKDLGAPSASRPGRRRRGGSGGEEGEKKGRIFQFFFRGGPRERNLHGKKYRGEGCWDLKWEKKGKKNYKLREKVLVSSIRRRLT